MTFIAALLLAAAPKMTDAQLMTKLHHVNQDEINAGKLGQSSCSTAYCKNYAQLLVQDHQAADTQLRQLAKKEGVNLDAALPREEMEKMHVMHAKMDQLKKMSGAEFDRGYGEVMKDGHADVISMLKEARPNVQHEELRTFIDAQMSKLNAHEDRAKALADGKSANRNEERQKASTGANTDRGASGRTPATEMHKASDVSKDRANRTDAPADTSSENAAGTDKR